MPKSALGSQLWLHHGDRLGKSVLISSHGSYYKDNIPFSFADVQAGTRLHFYSASDIEANRNVEHMLVNRNHKIIETIGATDPAPPNYVLSKWQGYHGGGKIPETYATLGDAIAEARNPAKTQRRQNVLADYRAALDDKELGLAEKALSGIREVLAETRWDFDPVDVLTIRNRHWHDKYVFLHDAVIEAQRLRPSYKDFLCVFCRVPA